MTEALVRVAVVGCGDHGRGGHLTAYRQLIEAGEPAQIVAVCDQHPERARAVAEEFGVPAWYAEHEAMLEQGRPDAVSVATPPVAHRRVVLDALGAGAHVLCEKPFAMNAAEAEEMVGAAARAGKIISMGLQNRYVPAARYLRALFTGDRSFLPAAARDMARIDLGAVYHTRVWAGHVLRLPPSPHFFRPELAGGGVIAATAVHILDAVLWMLGNPPIATVSAATYAKTANMARPPAPYATREEAAAGFSVEDFGYGLVRFTSGATLSIETSWLMHPTRRATGAEFLAANGVAEYSPLAVRLDAGGKVEDVTPPAELVPERRGHYFVEVARDFLRAARTNAPTPITERQIVQVQRLLDGLYRSAHERHEVAFPGGAGR